ncbi:acyl carrier protein [Bacteroides caccae]|jgi:acyl carrier protein|uniref:acyl carrier protein n=1 Tax=Bacteroides caccae TaxID=47678 RepID=UPI000EFF36FF|nr:acyl carrier protein [Bacteroides caccae]
MDNNEILAKLQDIIRETVDNEDIEITNATVATDIDGWDSLAQVMIVGEIRNEFGVKLTSTEVASLGNVGAMVAAIAKKL